MLSCWVQALCAAALLCIAILGFGRVGLLIDDVIIMRALSGFSGTYPDFLPHSYSLVVKPLVVAARAFSIDSLVQLDVAGVLLLCPDCDTEVHAPTKPKGKKASDSAGMACSLCTSVVEPIIGTDLYQRDHSVGLRSTGSVVQL